MQYVLLSRHSSQVRFRGRLKFVWGCRRGQVSRTEWWPSLSDRDWQKLDGGCAARIMLNYFWHGAARNLKAQGGTLELMKEPDQQLKRCVETNHLQSCSMLKFYLSAVEFSSTAQSACEVQHVNCSHLWFDLLFAFLSRIVTFGWSAFV